MLLIKHILKDPLPASQQPLPRTFVLLYLAFVLKPTGGAHGDEQDLVCMEGLGKQVGHVLGRGVDAVLNSGSAFHGEELGAGWGTSGNKKNTERLDAFCERS